MKLNRKKIIAREFLLLFSCFIISGIAYVGTYPYNYVIELKADKLEKSIIPLTVEIQSIEKPINAKLSKQKWFYEKWQENSNLVDYDSISDFWKRLEYLHKEDSIEYKWNNVWGKPVLDFNRSLGFKSPSQLDKFINDNSLDNNELNTLKKADPLKSKLVEIENQIRDKKNKMLELKDQLNFALLFLIITGIIAFPIRFLYNAIRWSVRTLNQKE